MPGSQTMLVLYKRPQRHDSGHKAQQASQPASAAEIHDQQQKQPRQGTRLTRGGWGSSDQKAWVAPAQLCTPVPVPVHLGPWTAELKLAAQVEGGQQPRPVHCQHRRLLNRVSEPRGQCPVQHLQLAAFLAFALEVSANSGTAAVLSAQETPAPLPAPSLTTRGETIGSVRSSCVVRKLGEKAQDG